MYNDWLTIGPITIHGYGVMIAVGILMAFFVGEKQAKKHNMDANQVDNLIFVCLATGFLGSKITYILTNWQAFLLNPKPYLGADGWVVWGGIIGGLIGAFAWCKWKKLDYKGYLNLLFPEVALAQGFGRIGCFFAGCCYGKETHGIGLKFPSGSLAPSGVTLVPTQLISSFGDFVLFYILFRNFNEGKHPEDTDAWYLILYSVGRFVVEMFRGDEIRGHIGIFSTSQFISIFMFAAGLILLYLHQKDRDETKSQLAGGAV